MEEVFDLLPQAMLVVAIILVAWAHKDLSGRVRGLNGRVRNLERKSCEEPWPSRRCDEGGECVFSLDLEYDPTGETINCERCGSAPDDPELFAHEQAADERSKLHDGEASH